MRGKILFVGLMFIAISTNAQIARQIKVSTENSHLRLACQDQFAGSVTINTTGSDYESNDINLNVMYLCFNDQIQLEHDGMQDLTNDPNPGTPPGIGYAFYDCAPSISGPDISTILTDPCLNHSPKVLNGSFVFQTKGMWVATDQANGDILFDNDGHLQNEFNNGNPIQFWFSPITLDGFNGQDQEAGGACVNSNIADAFSVVYLNSIQVSNPQTNTSSFTGSFTVQGGLPQFDGSTYPQISIVNTVNPTVMGTVSGGPYSDGETINFSVPQPGTYEIFVEDGKSCGSNTMEFSFPQDTVTFTLNCMNGQPGDQICISVTPENFDSIVSASFSLHWNPQVFTFDSLSNVHPDFSDPLTIAPFPQDGNVKVAFIYWADILNGISYPDGTVLFEVCLEIIGPPGLHPVTFADYPVTIEVYGANSSVESPTITNGCQIEVLEPSGLTAYSASCADPGSMGNFQITVFGGTAPYSIIYSSIDNSVTGSETINSNSGSVLITNIPSGDYNVIITDNNGDQVNTTASIADEPSLQLLNGTLTDPSCVNLSDGRINVPDAQGGVIPYTYQWSNGFLNTTSLNGLSIGDYTLTVTDSLRCSVERTYTLTSNNVEPQLGYTNATCDGVSDGSAFISYSGSALPLSYQWNVASTNSGIFSIPAGSYSVTTTDANGCEYYDQIEITNSKSLEIIVDIDSTSCYDTEDGRISATVNEIGGVAALPYTFNWENQNGQEFIGSNISPLPPGVYYGTVVDNSGCTEVDTFFVGQPTRMAANDAIQDASCDPGADGAINPRISGGTPSYTYAWSNGETTAALTNIQAGMYDLTVTDSKNCMENYSYEIIQNRIDIEIDSIAGINCPGDNTGILGPIISPTITVSSLLWNTGQTSDTIRDLSSGMYVLTVEDPRGCVGVDSIVFFEPLPLVPADTTFSLPTCPGDNNGTITLFLEGGTGPYSYNWSTGVSSSDPLLPGLIAGSYQVTVTDAYQCFTDTLDLTLQDPAHIEGVFTDVLMTTCPDGGDCDGAVSIEVSGGTEITSQYNFFWSSGATIGSGSTMSRATDLCPGEQFVVVANSTCADSFFVNIPSPDSIEIDLLSSQLYPANCFATNDASANILAIGGTPGYSYMWDNGTIGPNISGVFAGDYAVSITDMNGCEFLDTITLGEPEPISAWIDTVLTQDVTCAGSTDGSIFVNYTGGNPGPVDYTWTNNISDSSFALDVEPGFYIIEVFDTNGCTAQTFWTVNEPPTILAYLSGAESVMCFGQTNTVIIDSAVGGNGPAYRWRVNDGPPLPIAIGLDLGAGDYNIEIIDQLGCIYDTTINIVQPPEISLNAGPDLEVKLGNSANINLLYSSFHGISQIFWDPAEGIFCEDPNCDLITITPSVSTTYTVTLLDTTGCAVSDELFIDVNASRDVFIPNVFSPNKDGYNDKFSIFTGPGIRSINSMQIFDRWGEMVFEKLNVVPSSAGTVGWNGEYGGKILNPAVFIYLIEIEFIDDTVLLYRGDVTLIR